jgi:hypothetical protein
VRAIHPRTQTDAPNRPPKPNPPPESENTAVERLRDNQEPWRASPNGSRTDEQGDGSDRKRAGGGGGGAAGARGRTAREEFVATIVIW